MNRKKFIAECETYTLKELKNKCKNSGLSVSGNKKELCERLEKHFYGKQIKLSDLPPEIHMNILKNFDAKDLSKSKQISKYFNEIVDNSKSFRTQILNDVKKTIKNKFRNINFDFDINDENYKVWTSEKILSILKDINNVKDYKSFPIYDIDEVKNESVRHSLLDMVARNYSNSIIYINGSTPILLIDELLIRYCEISKDTFKYLFSAYDWGKTISQYINFLERMIIFLETYNKFLIKKEQILEMTEDDNFAIQLYSELVDKFEKSYTQIITERERMFLEYVLPHRIVETIPKYVKCLKENLKTLKSIK